MAPTGSITCRGCGRKFKRQDHLARHELSHSEARYYCQVTTCGMAFHRRDVLKRHERVHQLDPTKTRRRPRRGIAPVPRPAMASTTLRQTQQPRVKRTDSNVRNTLNSQTRGLLPLDSLTTPTLDPLDFCVVHYLEMCNKRWPFMHHSSLQQTHMAREKRLAMAALGGSIVPEYRSAAAMFFTEARELLVVTHGSNAASAIKCRLQKSLHSRNDSVLELIQTHMLLLEYALWHIDADVAVNAREWAIALTFEYAAVILPQLQEHLKSLQESEQSWADEIYEEQMLRATWTFYCIMQKAMANFPCSISILRSQKHLRLPCSDILFNAPDEQSWSDIRNKLTARGVDLTSITLKAILHLIQSSDMCAERQFIVDLPPMARHVVLVALLEICTNGLQYVPSATNSQDTHDICIDLMRTIRTLWHMPPDELFFSSPPRSMDLQNVLLLNHLHIRALLHFGRNEGIAQHRSNLCVAATIANEVFTPILRRGAMNVNAGATWLTDSASKRYVVGMAQTMVNWARTMKSAALADFSADNHEACHGVLYEQVKEALKGHKPGPGPRDASGSGLDTFAEDLENAWSDILRCPTVRWYPQSCLASNPCPGVMST